MPVVELPPLAVTPPVALPLLLLPLNEVPPVPNPPLSTPRKAVLLHAVATSIENAKDAGMAMNATCDFMGGTTSLQATRIEIDSATRAAPDEAYGGRVSASIKVSV
jgi:hypothetical protein